MRDARLQPVSDELAASFATQNKVSVENAKAHLEALRLRQIELQQVDPYENGYEPPIWYVAKSLVRNPYWSDYERKMIAKRFPGMRAEDFAVAMRTALGLKNPVTKLLIMGSNRSGKTDFASKLCLQAARAGGKFVGSGAQTHKTQKQNQMARVWRYMPNDWKEKNIATQKAKDVVENISYTPKNGFAGSKITFANGSIINFVTYEQNIAALEGVEYDLVHLDEEYGVEYYNLMTTRITSRAGVFLGTFTPLHGYTPQIAKFLDGAVVTRWHTAYLRPADGGAMLPWKELNLSQGEYERLVAWRRSGMEGDPCVPESRPEDCFGWLVDCHGLRHRNDGQGVVGVPLEQIGVSCEQGRVFQRVPRVMVCQGGQAAAVWFYGSDNPYGLPSELILTKMADPNAEQRIYEAVYGMARNLKGRIFKTEHIESAIVPDEDVPPLDELLKIMVIDPAPERNWTMAWFGFHAKTGILYLYREFPGNYEVTGQGIPGPWVVPSDRNGGLNDGARGDGQTSFGFSYHAIKFEVARLEGWSDFEQYLQQGGRVDKMPEDLSFVEAWQESNGTREVIEERILDSRAASQSKISRMSNQTLLSDLGELFAGMTVADGQRTEVGYTKLNDLLASGKIKIAKSCCNMIDCLKMLTGRDGLKGACKDFADMMRYAIMSDIWDYQPDEIPPEKRFQPSERTVQNRPCEAFQPRKSRVWW